MPANDNRPAVNGAAEEKSRGPFSGSSLANSTAAVRFSFRRRDLDHLGVLSPDSLRDLARHLWDCPSNIPVIVDLGPCRQLQLQLLRDLSLYRCASSVRFSGTDWWAVRDHTRALATALGVAA